MKEEEIAKELQGQKVIKVERIKRKINNELADTPLHILTFNTTELPLQIKAGFLRLDVRLYLPNPMRCHTCQQYGHTKARCNRQPVCPKCAKCIPKGHEETPCEIVKCANCKLEHTTFDKNCPILQMEKAIIKIKTIERITYYRAKEIYYRQNANTTGATAGGQPKATYSETLQKEKNISKIVKQNNSNNINSKENENSKKNNNQIKTNNQNTLNNNTNKITEAAKTDNNETKTTTTTASTTINKEQTSGSSTNVEKPTTKMTTINKEDKLRKYTFLNPNELDIALEMD